MNISKRQAEAVCKHINEKLVKISFLAKGNHNSNYILQTSKNKYLLRIEDNQQFKNLKKEFQFLKNAKLGLGPKVYLFDNSHNIIPNDYLIEEFIYGSHPSKMHPTNDFVVEMAKWFKELHKMTKKSHRQGLLLNKVSPYYKNYLKYKINLPKSRLSEMLQEYVAKSLEILKQNSYLFTNRKTVSLLHNDASSGNIFYQHGRVRLIDWEFSSYGLPERELVYFIDSYHLTKRQQDLFLKRYGYLNSKGSKVQLNMAYIILLFSSIGYSLWQLDILLKNKSPKKDRAERLNRLARDTNLLIEKVNELKK